MLQTTAQVPFSAKFSPPPKKPSTRDREYLRSSKIKAMIRAAKKVGRHGVILNPIYKVCKQLEYLNQ